LEVCECALVRAQARHIERLARLNLERARALLLLRRRCRVGVDDCARAAGSVNARVELRRLSNTAAAIAAGGVGGGERSFNCSYSVELRHVDTVAVSRVHGQAIRVGALRAGRIVLLVGAENKALASLARGQDGVRAETQAGLSIGGI